MPIVSKAAFKWDYKRFTSVGDFAAYLNTLTDAQIAWIQGLTIHHTYIPTLAQWNKTAPTLEESDRRRMEGLAEYYRTDVSDGAGGKGWSAGPHLFVTDHSILIGTPLTTRGIHATVCNDDRVGMEVVGDYDRVGWSAATEAFAVGAIAAILRRRKLKPNSKAADNMPVVNGHRDCNSPKTCPGKAISLSVVRTNIERQMGMTQPLPIPTPTDDRGPLIIGVTEQNATVEQCIKYMRDDGVTIDMLSDIEIRRLYQLASDLGVDFSATVGMWKQESFWDNPNDAFPNRAVIGGSILQQQTRMPGNMVTTADDHRHKVKYNNRYWMQAGTWQLGYIKFIAHLKDHYGDMEGLFYLRDILKVYAPKEDGNDPKTYGDNVITRMTNMRNLKV
jgi:hypothetical protein